MDKTLFELVPVSVKPEKEQWYILLNPKRPDEPCPIYFENGNWQEEPFGLTHYLRPLTPPVAEERILLDSIKEVMGCTCPEIYKSRGMAAPDCAECNYAEDIAAHLLKRFNITKK